MIGLLGSIGGGDDDESDKAEDTTTTADESKSQPTASSEPSPVASTPECVKVKAAGISAIAFGLRSKTAEVEAAYSVPFGDETGRLRLAHAVAVRVAGPGGPADVVLSVQKEQVAGGMILASEPALDWLVWGEAVNDGSAAAEERDEVANSDAAEAALTCLK